MARDNDPVADEPSPDDIGERDDATRQRLLGRHFSASSPSAASSTSIRSASSADGNLDVGPMRNARGRH
jgi:hypothetical protein